MVTPTRITSVRLVGDILATRESEQVSNLRWLADLLKRPIQAALPAADFVVGPDDKLSRSQVLDGAVDMDELAKRHCWFDAEKINPLGTAALQSVFGPGTLVIGYELSHPTRSALDAAGVTWIDIWLHPVRFADDVLFGIRSSDATINKHLMGFEVSDESLFAQADLLKVQSYRGFTKRDMRIVSGSALFVGQTPFDKSVLGANGFVSLSDFSDEFNELTAKHPHVYFSRHPHAPRLDPKTGALLSQSGNVSEISAPTYGLLADDRISTVASISSSVLEEARYFGKDTVRLYRSPFELRGPDRYVPVLQDFCFSHFWATILCDLADTKPAPPASFLSSSNKLRHSLSFYWGYQDIDRYEYLAKSGAPQGVLQQDEEVDSGPDAVVASFDIFDTLVGRRVASPRDVFHLMSNAAGPIAGLPPEVFAEKRIDSEKQARARANKLGREEPTLHQIYTAMLGESHEGIGDLAELEIATEIEVCEAREAGRQLFEAARSAGRQIILVSDMYLPAGAIEKILANCGYEGWDRLYVSSEVGLTKRNSGMFDQILDDLEVEPNLVHHVGDNRHSDVEVAKANGLRASHLPTSLENLERSAPFLKSAAARIYAEGPANGSAVLSQIARKHFDRTAPGANWSDFGRDPAAFGYICLGPLIAGFAEWLHEQAVESGYQTLGFLTREGPIFRAAFRELFPASETSVETVFASRRLARYASFRTEEQIRRSARHLRPGKYRDVADMLAVEYGLPAELIDGEALKERGIASDTATSSPKVTGPLLGDIAEIHATRIVKHAASEREKLAAYLSDVGLGQGKVAVVDIGYAGNMQAAFSDVLSHEIEGLYMATFRTAKDVLEKAMYAGFLANGVDPGDRRYGICRFRKIYETLLCSPGPGFVGVKKGRDGWEGVPSSLLSDTPIRDEFVTKAHQGALEFVEEYQAYRLSGTRISPVTAAAFLEECLKNPSPELAAWLGKLEFDDRLDQHASQSLADRVAGADRSLWAEGAKQLKKRRTKPVPRKTGPDWSPIGPYGLLGWRHIMTPVVASFVASIGNETDADHYRDDPIGFFRRLSDRRYRRIGRILYPWD